MRTKTLLRAIAVIALVAACAPAAYSQSDSGAILQFQRAADSYAFAHRRDERRNAAAAPLVEGQFFTPIVAAAFRGRIRAATAAAGCAVAARGEGGSEVPAMNASAARTEPLPSCVASALPRMPEELQYRVAGVALILVDAHRNVVVDVLHAAFP
jgi:hypothetical protein